MRPGRAGVLRVALACVLGAGAHELHVGRALADTLTEVTVDAHGPNQDLPLRSSFYLTGDAEKDAKLQAVQPVFVRISWPVWAGAFKQTTTCSEVRKSLGDPTIDALFGPEARVRRASDIWRVRANSDYDDAPVYAPAAWKRSAGDKAFKVLVGQPSFFHAGARYCLFLYEQRQVDASKVVGPLQTYARAVVACKDKEKSCTNAPQAQLEKDLEAFQLNVPPAQRLAADRALGTGLLSAVMAIAAGPRDIDDRRKALDACRPRVELPGLGASPYVSVTDAKVGPPALLDALLSLLVRQGLAFFHKESSKDTNGFFHDEKDKVVIRFAGLTPDLAGLRVASEEHPGPKAETKISLDGKALSVPGTTTSVFDLVRFSTGSLNGVSLTEVVSTPPDAAKIDKLRVGAHALRDALQAITKHDDEIVLTDLANWLGESVSKCDQRASDLEQSIKDYQAAQTALAGNLDTVLALTAATDVLLDLPAQLHMTQKDYITSYITPTLGYATLPGRDSTVAYGSVQVYFWPNPVDEPMWTNGSSDVRRMFAAELGLGLKKDSFGPQEQYGGVWGLPPVFVGGALQFAPYSTLSAGAMLLSSRRTALPQEHAQTTAAPYIGVSIQGNIPDLIRSLAVGSGTSATSTAAAK